MKYFFLVSTLFFVGVTDMKSEKSLSGTNPFGLVSIDVEKEPKQKYANIIIRGKRKKVGDIGDGGDVVVDCKGTKGTCIVVSTDPCLVIVYNDEGNQAEDVYTGHVPRLISSYTDSEGDLVERYKIEQQQ
ncbi:MAG: hypothetical protein KF734_21440 [Saprospiraceae bacterium]|nr:hypothetical protein [Saprospiraceae bacterium]